MTYKKDDIVNFIGTTYYNNSGASAAPHTCTPGIARVTAISEKAAHPYHLIYISKMGSNVYGWVDEASIGGLYDSSTPLKALKYSDKNPPLECYMYSSNWYKGAVKNSKPIGILWHDTGAGNPMIKRYVQPDDKNNNYDEMMKLLGKNRYGNDWNHSNREAGVNAFIGELEDGTITTVQVGPWEMAPWGCGGGTLGSCNGYIRQNGSAKWIGQHWIQFEICDEGYTDPAYFKKVYEEAIQLTAYLCKKYNLNPKGTVKFAGIDVPVITCHYDSYKMKLGSNHGDVLTWFKKMGKTMVDVRNDVATALEKDKPIKVTSAITSTKSSAKTALSSAELVLRSAIAGLEVGDMITLKPKSTYYTGKIIPDWVFKAVLYARKIKDKTVTFSTLKEGAVTGTVYKEAIASVTKQKKPFSPYIARIKADALNIRAAADSKSKVVGTVYKGQAFTIMEEKNGFGRLKSGAGWISLAYTEKVIR